MKNTKRFLFLALIGLVCAGVVSAQTFGIDRLSGGLSRNMVVYEKYGLTYDRTKEAYCYNNKIIGLLVDRDGIGIQFINPSGEIHIRAVRDATGKITGLAELTPDEYTKVIDEIDAMQIAINERMEKIRENMTSRRNLPQRPRFSW
jgi:hypothetical protein